MLGPPLLFNGRLDESMKQEHTARDDSSLEFTSSNGVTTTSATEWEVAIAPQPACDYPDRAGFAPGDVRRRARHLVTIEELVPAMEERNKKLLANKQSVMVRDELIAARLYTGPMYHKYNLVLRSFSGVAFLQLQFERDCKGNLYATTIHGINSAVIKLSKLQVACPVYRGSTRAVLPAQFWQKDDFGLSGGVEFGFTSTTVERAQALHYAQGQASLVFESQMGLIDRGADISWLSQYPHEREVLFGPLLGQQPLAARVAGGSLVVETRMSLNMMSLTLEQVLNKRFRLLKEMGAGMVMEVHAAFAGSGYEAHIAELLRTKLDATVLEKAASYYNDDPNFMQTVQGMLQLKNGETGLDAVAKLEDSEGRVRKAAVQTLGKLPPEVLAAHAAAVVAKLEHSNSGVREAAVQTLFQLPPEVVAAHAAAVVAKLEDSSWYVRRAAVQTLGKLPAEVLAAHAAAVLAKLEDSAFNVREAAVETLGQLPPAELTKHKAPLQKVEKEDKDEDVRRAAAEALSKLQASE